MSPCPTYSFFFFFFNDPATTEIYTLSLHDALPIFVQGADHRPVARMAKRVQPEDFARRQARGLRGAENQLGGECVRTELVDRRRRERGNACADDGKEVEHESRVVAGREVDRLSL